MWHGRSKLISRFSLRLQSRPEKSPNLSLNNLRAPPQTRSKRKAEAQCRNLPYRPSIGAYKAQPNKPLISDHAPCRASQGRRGRVPGPNYESTTVRWCRGTCTHSTLSPAPFTTQESGECLRWPVPMRSPAISRSSIPNLWDCPYLFSSARGRRQLQL